MSRHDPGQQYVLCAIAIAASLCTVSLPPCAGQISDRTFHWIRPPVTSVCPFSQGVPIIPFL